ncbi:MAG TPA: glycoside hydrolase family 30 beta sandwich domain-containing protein, partial [Polyangia bacterium]|nr:glycoside hydrolase family 30 beta sandwich domain-containing protein [Polyangia bacterium]
IGGAGASGSAGSGGSTGNGGRGGSGGAAGPGGTTGSGGTAGGTTGSGGTAAGGSKGTGGTAGGGSTGTGGGSSVCGGGSAMSGDVTVDLSSLQQKISGFGASTAWGSTMSSSDADLLWSTSTGAGLSLHRVRIDYQTGQTSELAIAKMAVAHGVTVWATPWTPPAADKTGNTGANGEVEGNLSNGSAYATFLTGFVSYMKGQGVNIFAVSAGNEPDANVTYESCAYTGATMDSFITSYMGPAFAGSGVKVMAPETQNWCGFPNFEPTLVKNSYVSIIATHEYGCSPTAYPDIAKAGKEFWETEIYDQGGTTTADPGMGSGLRVAKLINDALTIANMNAWHYWWVYSSSAGNGALWDMTSGQASKRLWVEGNYARFVRPGFQRVGTTGTAPSGVLLSAYKNPADGTVAIVAINNNTTSTPISFFVSGAAPCSLTPWVTSSTDSLASKTAVSVSGSRASFTLGAQSVTTLVGKP